MSAAEVCGTLFGPADGPPLFCSRPKGHGGDCRTGCTAVLVTPSGERLTCELCEGHDGLHGVWPEALPSTQWADEETLCGATLTVGDPSETFVCDLPREHEGEHRMGIRWAWTDDAVGAVLPSGAGEEPQEAPEGASGAEDEPRTASDVYPAEEIKQTAPVFVTELVAVGHVHWLQKLPDGGMQLKLVAAQQSPQGPRLQMPAYVFEFTPEGWESFKRSVESDGDAPPPAVKIATVLPPGLR